jgi:methyl-accepting chemotaxis protein
MELLLMAEGSRNEEVKTVESFASLVNEYGFMIVFSVVVLIMVIIFFIRHEKRSGRKQDQELKLITKEREAAIEQNQKMFELVTKTQNEQVVQLREMTDSLRDMNKSSQMNEGRIVDAMTRIEEIRQTTKSCDEKSKVILDTITDILASVKTSQECNHDILDKINLLERKLIHEVDKE